MTVARDDDGEFALVGGRPPHHWKTITFVDALRLCGLTAPMVLDGPMNGPGFLAHLEQVLVHHGG